MRLTVFSDYSLRVLMYLALHPDRFVTIPEIAGAYGISSNHLMKVAQHLAATGDVVSLRGPRGGLRLARPAVAIRVGAVVRGTEPGMVAMPCGACVIQPGCGLPAVLDRAVAAFLAVLDECTVADLAGGLAQGGLAQGGLAQGGLGDGLRREGTSLGAGIEGDPSCRPA